MGIFMVKKSRESVLVSLFSSPARRLGRGEKKIIRPRSGEPGSRGNDDESFTVKTTAKTRLQ